METLLRVTDTLKSFRVRLAHLRANVFIQLISRVRPCHDIGNSP